MKSTHLSDSKQKVTMLEYISSTKLRWIAVPMIFCVVALSISACDAGGVVSETQKEEASPRYGGKTIFEGLFFAKGPVAEQFPEIWNNEKVGKHLSQMSSDEASQAEEIQEKIVRWIRSEHPDFFEEFGAAMQSGNHVKIRRTLEQTSSMLRVATTDVTNFSERQLIEGAQAAKAETCAALVVVLVVAAAVAVVVWVTVGAQASEDSSRLKADDLVDTIATRLNVQAV